MHLISDLKPALARLTRLSTLAVASTAVAAVATTWLITGSVDPTQWLADYQQSRQPTVVRLQQNNQPPAAVEASPSPTAAPAEPESTPPPAAPSAQQPPPASSSTPDDGEFEGGDD